MKQGRAAANTKREKSNGKQDRAAAWNFKRKTSKVKQGSIAANTKRKKSYGKQDRAAALSIGERRVKGTRRKSRSIEYEGKESRGRHGKAAGNTKRN